MSETPKSGRFGFAAMLQWARSGQGYRYVPMLLIVALILGTCCETAFGQDSLYFPGQTIHTINFEQPPYDSPLDNDANFFTEDERAAITRVVDYLNDVIDVPSQYFIDWVNGVVGFHKINVEGTATGGPGGPWNVTIYSNGSGDPSFVPEPGVQSSQTVMHAYENMVLHELGHVLGIGIGAGSYTEDELAGTVTFSALEDYWPWGQYLRDPDGEVIEVDKAYSRDDLFLFVGQNAAEAYGDFWFSGESKGVSVNPITGGFSHPWDPPGAVMTYRGYLRDFFTEVELAILQDLGYTIDRSRFFGRSLYQIHSETILNYTAFNGDGTFGVGLHFVLSDAQPNSLAAGNTVIQYADLISTGYLGAGIRVEGYNHSVTIADGVTVAGNGEGGIGIVITLGSGTTIINRGTIEATGLNGTGVWIDNGPWDIDDDWVYNSVRLDNSGGFNAGTNNAIYIATGGWDYVPDHDAITINNLRGSNITGNIVSDTFNSSTTLTFGKRTSANGSAIDDGDTADFTISVVGNIDGKFDIETWGGTTIIDGNTNALSGIVGEGAVKSTLILSGDASFTNGLTVTQYGTLGTGVALEGFDTLNITGDLTMQDGSTLLVDIGVNNTSDMVNVHGTADIGAIYINLTSLLAGEYSLILADIMEYEDNAIILLNGGTIGTGQTAGIITNAQKVGDSLLLTIEGKLFNGILSWTGAVNNTWDITTANWSGDETRFFDGDAVSFGLSGTHVITISGTGKTVSDMTVSGSGNWTFNGNILGDAAQTTLENRTGALTKTGSGTLTLNGENEFRGGTTVTEGTLQIGSGGTVGSIKNNIVNNANVTFNRSDTHTYDYVLSGTGTVTKNGGGTLVLTRDNTYTGMTTVNAGGLQIGAGGNSGSIASNIYLNGSTTFVTFNRADNMIFGNLVSGTGSLTKRGAGVLTLTGSNTYTGKTNVYEGTLQIGNGGSSGSVTSDIDLAPDTNLTFDRTGSILFGNVISGAGSLTKKGAGSLTLTSVNTYTGLTLVENGTLFVGNGIGTSASIAGNVLVGNAGTLGGYGTIGGTVDVYGMLMGFGTILGHITLRDGATFSPGGSIGTLEIHDGITFESGSTYLFEINKGVPSTDLLVVTDGTVTIEDGAILDIQLTGRGARGDEFLMIEVTDGAHFNDATLFTLADTWTEQFTQSIRSDGYWVSWVALPPEFANNLRAFGTPNAIRAAAGVDQVFEGEWENQLGNLYDTLSSMPANDPQSLANAFAQLHGEVFAANKLASVQMQRLFQQLMPTGRDFVSREDLTRMSNRWGTFTGDRQHRKDIGQYSGYDLNSVGVAFGMDRTILTDLFLGVAIGYDNTYQKFDTIRSSAQSDSFRSMVYGSWFNGKYFLDAYAGYTKNRYETKRNININNTFSATARSRYGEDLASTGLEVGRQFERKNGVLLTPSVGLHYVHIGHSSITESGGGDANLHIAADNYQSFQIPIGIKVSRVFTGSYGIALIPEIRTSYVREMADDSASVRTSFARVQDVTFIAESGERGRDIGRFGFGVSAQLPKRVNFRFDYDYEVYRHTSASTLAASLGMSW